MCGWGGLDQCGVCTDIILNKQKRGILQIFIVCVCGGASMGGVCLFSFFEVHHTKTLANQELGCTPWPLASLSQGDPFAKVLRLDPLD